MQTGHVSLVMPVKRKAREMMCGTAVQCTMNWKGLGCRVHGRASGAGLARRGGALGTYVHVGDSTFPGEKGRKREKGEKMGRGKEGNGKGRGGEREGEKDVREGEG